MALPPRISAQPLNPTHLETAAPSGSQALSPSAPQLLSPSAPHLPICSISDLRSSSDPQPHSPTADEGLSPSAPEHHSPTNPSARRPLSPSMLSSSLRASGSFSSAISRFGTSALHKRLSPSAPQSLNPSDAQSFSTSASQPRSPLTHRTFDLSRPTSLRSQQHFSLPSFDSIRAEDPKPSEAEDLVQSLSRLRLEREILGTIVDESYLHCTLGFAGSYDERMRQVKEGIASSHLASILYTSKPFASAMAKPILQVIMIVFALAALIEDVRDLFFLISSMRGSTAKNFRMVPLELRNGSVAPNISGFAQPSGMGVMLNMCEEKMAKTLIDRGSEGLELQMSQPVRFNGWYFETSTTQSPDIDPLRFQLWAQRQNGAEWEQVGSSRTTHGFIAKRLHLLDSKADISLQRGVRVVFEHSPPWQLWLRNICYYFIHFLFIVTALTGHYGDPLMAKWPFIVSYCLSSVTELAVGAAYCLQSDAWIGSLWIIRGVGNGLIFPVSLVFYEHLAVWALKVFGAWIAIFQPLFIKFVLPFEFNGFREQLYLIVLGCGWMAFALAFDLSRQVTVYYARRNIAGDKARYDEAWSTLISDASQLSNLDRLDAMIQKLQPPPKKLKQKSRKFSNTSNESHVSASVGLDRRLSDASERSSTAPIFRRPVSSSSSVAESIHQLSHLDRKRDLDLEQMFAQSAAMHAIFREKVKEWAEYALVPVTAVDSAASQLRPWSEVRDDDDLLEKVVWADRKSVERTIEKATRTYANDVSRVLDIVRQSLIFDTLEGLIATVGLISMDPEIRIERVKNRYQVDYQTWQTAGYRDVIINLRLVNQDTLKLGVEMHICELQLVLKSFAELRQADGHRRYVAYRNARGE